MQILVLGMHRSGTSATARLINMMGAYFAPEGVSLPANRYNPKGYWERQDVMRLNDMLLKFHHCRWQELAQWQFEKAPVVPVELRRPMQRLVMEMDAHRPWFLKDPRLCLTLPAWLPLLEAPVTVLVHRDPLEIAFSLVQRDQMPPAYSLALWEYYTVGMLNATLDLPRLLVQHSELLQKPVETCQKIFDYLGSQEVRRLAMPGAREINAFIDPGLHHSTPEKAKAIALSSAQIALTDILHGKRLQEAVLEVSPESHALIKAGLPVQAPGVKTSA